MANPIKKVKHECYFLSVNNNDVLTKIMKLLPVKDVTSLGATCKRMQDLNNRDNLWFYLLLRDHQIIKDPIFDKDVTSKEVYKEETTVARILTNMYCSSIGNQNPLNSIFGYSCVSGDIKIAKSCLRRGAKLYDYYQCSTPFNYACLNGQLDIVKLLVHKNININYVDQYGWTGLMEATRYGKTAVVRYLLKKGADVKIQNWGSHETALDFAIQNCDNTCASLLKKYAGDK